MVLAIFLCVHGMCRHAGHIWSLFETLVMEIMIFHDKVNQNEIKQVSECHLNVFGSMVHHNLHDFQNFKKSKISPSEALCGHQKIKIWTLEALRGNFNSAL